MDSSTTSLSMTVQGEESCYPEHRLPVTLGSHVDTSYHSRVNLVYYMTAMGSVTLAAQLRKALPSIHWPTLRAATRPPELGPPNGPITLA